MHSNYQNSITVQHVIDYIGIDRSYASRIFHRFENRTIQQYLIGIRMNKARRLLEDGQLSVRNVALSVGYRDYSTFERRFRRETGCSPSAYTDR
jgi:AraC family transcriptional regulator of arabinose operon